jgi:tRNA (adenine22-N1)-methyltransferase
MNLSLSPRLLACSQFVTPGSWVADVGCDHGYLSIYLLKNGIAQRVIASDINEQPLLSAVNNAEKYGVRDRITFCLSDGVKAIPRDFDCMICAGMGADTMISILEAAPWLKSSAYTLILQCQSKTPTLRRYLSQQGWSLDEDAVLRDGRFLYTVMRVLWNPSCEKLTPGQQYFSPALLKRPSKELAEYYRWVTEGLRLTTAHQNDSEKAAALAELEQLAQNPQLNWLKEDTV